MQSGTARHGQAASALSETRSKYILNPSKLPGLDRGRRRPEQVLDWLRAVCADPNRHSIGFAQCAQTQTGARLASRSVRGPKQALDWLRAVCADPNRHSIGFAQCARPKTGTRLASRSVRGPKQALDWLRAVCAAQNRHSIGASGTPARFAGYKANSTSFLYQANSPGLGRGLREAKQTNGFPL